MAEACHATCPRSGRVEAMRALVTGAGGFVGGWLLAHLHEQGDEVVAVDHEVDVTDCSAVKKAVMEASPDVIFHLAALSHVGKSWEDPAAALKVNAVGTLFVLEAARACPSVPRVVLVSSAEVYGVVAPEDLPVSESAPLQPVTPYAVSKVAAEYAGIQAYLAHGTPVIRVRPFNHVGPGQSASFAVAALASRIVEAEVTGVQAIAVGNLSARRDLTDVRDVVRAYRLLAAHGSPGEVYNVCSGRDVSVEDVARRLIEMAGADLEMVVDPALVRPVDIPVLRGDPSRLREATGWEPMITLDVTLHDVLESWRQKLPAHGAGTGQ